MNRLLLYAVLLLMAVGVWAPLGACSGIDITNVTLGTRDPGTGNVTVTFNASWSNSWRSTGGGAPAPNNWDAAWIFVKFRKNGGDWQHASLNNSGHTAPSGSVLDVGFEDTSAVFNIASNPGIGAFLYRSSDGTGTFTANGVVLSWKYTQDGVSDGDTLEVRVFGIEMVHVPEGPFFAGDGSNANNALRQGSTDTDPWYISSESALTTSNTAGNGSGSGATEALYYHPGGSDAAGSVYSLANSYPKGYQAFYMMKGEISQDQWLAFFNMLNATQKSTRDITGASGKNSDSLTYRNNLSWSGTGDATLPDQGAGATYRAVAMNYLTWADVAAYLDWSGLRPMSELEFERTGRGPYPALANEYAWGSTAFTQGTSITSGGTLTERAQSGSNAAYGSHASIQGPVRVGSFGYNVATRIDAGAGYYGGMNLSDNVAEVAVTIGSSSGRSFSGRYHGDGTLNASGNHDTLSWPATNGTGVGYRGGRWGQSTTSMTLSYRGDAAAGSSSRDNDTGGRGVRVAYNTTPTPTPTPAATNTSTPTPAATNTPTATPAATNTPTATPTATPTSAGGVNSTLVATTAETGGAWGFSCEVTGTDTVRLMYATVGSGQGCPSASSNSYSNYGDVTNGTVGFTCSNGGTICCYTVTAGYTGNTPSDGGVIQSDSEPCGEP
jgi:hypothetical protein